MHRATQCLQLPCQGTESGTQSCQSSPALPQLVLGAAGGIHGRHWSQRPRSGHLYALLGVHLSLPLTLPWPLKAFLKPHLPRLTWMSSELLSFSGGIHSLLCLPPATYTPSGPLSSSQLSPSANHLCSDASSSRKFPWCPTSHPQLYPYAGPEASPRLPLLPYCPSLASSPCTVPGFGSIPSSA